jgi:hypothetical protein
MGGLANVPVAPPPDPGTMVLVDGCYATQRATLFLHTNAKGVIYGLALQHQ